MSRDATLTPADYWQLRALSEQMRREQMEGELALLRARLESGRTQARLSALSADLKAAGVIDLTQGEWMPDDQQATFVKRDDRPSQDAPVKP